MSSLTRSLLALAVLLVAADAQENCKVVVFGEVTNENRTLDPVRTPAKGGRITIEDACASGKKQAVGELIKACNVDRNGVAPDIQEVNPPYLSPVDVVCSDQCPHGADVYITLYCFDF